MEDREQRALQESIDGRLATSTLLYLTEARAGLAADDYADRSRLNWLRGMLVRSVGGARQVAARGEALAPDIDATHGSPSEEIASYQQLKEFSGADTANEHAAWVQKHVHALDALRDHGWDGLEEEQQKAVDDLEPLLDWLSGGVDRASRRGPEPVRAAGG
jgi:hypothetical protein